MYVSKGSCLWRRYGKGDCHDTRSNTHFDSAPPGWINAEQDTGRPAFIDVAAGLVAGALLTRFIPRLVTDLGIDPPTAMATPSGGLGIGWTLGL